MAPSCLLLLFCQSTSDARALKSAKPSEESTRQYSVQLLVLRTNMMTADLVCAHSVLAWAATASASVYWVSTSTPASAGAPLLDAFVSYSIEFASFPDFAGNKSAPNTFSDALLSNLGRLTGTKPYIRVG
jgi:hypothetical protein